MFNNSPKSMLLVDLDVERIRLSGFQAGLEPYLDVFSAQFWGLVHANHHLNHRIVPILGIQPLPPANWVMDAFLILARDKDDTFNYSRVPIVHCGQGWVNWCGIKNSLSEGTEKEHVYISHKTHPLNARQGFDQIRSSFLLTGNHLPEMLTPDQNNNPQLPETTSTPTQTLFLATEKETDYEPQNIENEKVADVLGSMRPDFISFSGRGIQRIALNYFVPSFACALFGLYSTTPTSNPFNAQSRTKTLSPNPFLDDPSRLAAGNPSSSTALLPLVSEIAALGWILPTSTTELESDPLRSYDLEVKDVIVNSLPLPQGSSYLQPFRDYDHMRFCLMALTWENSLARFEEDLIPPQPPEQPNFPEAPPFTPPVPAFGLFLALPQPLNEFDIEHGPPELFEDFEPGNSDLTINLTPVT